MFDEQMIEMLWEGVIDTIYMTIASTALSYVFGMIMGVLLVICRKDGIAPRPVLYACLDVVVNLTRSFPFLILMIAVIPVTRFIVGTTIGNNATIVPLVIAAAPFIKTPALFFIPTISVFVLILCTARPKYEKEQSETDCSFFTESMSVFFIQLRYAPVTGSI